MQIAMIGLGRMGNNMAKRLMQNGHQLVAYDQNLSALAELKKLGAETANSLEELAQMLKPPRTAWVMVPHGDPVTKVIEKLSQVFSSGDIIIDGGNSPFLDSIKSYERLQKLGIHFVDVGVSGGIFGLDRGYCLMVGGDPQTFAYLSPIFASLAPGEKGAPKTPGRMPSSTAEQGYYYCGKAGAGHYVKMIHNAIEYGIMQSYAEGLELLENADAATLPVLQRYNFDLKEITELWRRGSVIGSWLLDLMALALAKDPELKSFSGMVPDSGEGRWALIEAIKQRTPTPNLANSLFTRFRSRKESSFAEKSLSALRREFGGHEEGPL